MKAQAIKWKLVNVDFYINAKKELIWQDKVHPKPTAEDLELWENEYNVYLESISWIWKRRDAYNAKGLTFEKWNELVIEEDTAGQTAFRSEREIIRAAIPKT